MLELVLLLLERVCFLQHLSHPILPSCNQEQFVMR